MTDLRLGLTGQDAALPPQAPHPEQRFGELVQEVRQAGLLDSQPLYYAAQIVASLALLAVGWGTLVTIGNSWWQLVIATFLGLCCTHVGFLGHDVSHRQVVRGRTGARLLGLLFGNLLLGFSYGGFVRHHNKHHANPNHLERDPDIARRRVILEPERGATRPGRVKQFIRRHQKVFFSPLLLAESLALRVATLKAMRNPTLGSTVVEGTLVVLHVVIYLAAVLTVLPPAKATAFVVLQQAVFGLYTELVIAPNHKAMPIQTPTEEWDWLERQLATSRNLRPSRLTSFIYGGQNYHIEHHLFPTMPRNNARHARPIVMAFCQRRGLPYHEVSVRESFVEMLGSLRRPAGDGDQR